MKGENKIKELLTLIGKEENKYFCSLGDYLEIEDNLGDLHELLDEIEDLR